VRDASAYKSVRPSDSHLTFNLNAKNPTPRFHKHQTGYPPQLANPTGSKFHFTLNQDTFIIHHFSFIIHYRDAGLL
jgi:hypothetical protein